MEDTELDTTGPPGEDAGLRQDKLAEMRRLLKERTEVAPRSSEDWYLVRFLRVRLFNVERALRLVQGYEAFRAAQGAGWTQVPRALLDQGQDAGVVQVLAARDAGGARVMWLRLGRWDPQVLPADSLLQLCGTYAEVAALEPRSQAAGVVALFDMAGLGLKQLRGLSPSFASKMVSYLGSSFPLQIKAIHVVRESMLFSLVYALFQGLLDDRMRARIFFHGHNTVSLLEHLPAGALPTELGGDLPPADMLWWRALLQSREVVEGLKKLDYVFVDAPA